VDPEHHTRRRVCHDLPRIDSGGGGGERI
jgi:hypothetical protein